MVERILSIGEQLTGLISKRAALIEGGITQTFIEYQAHFEILNAASDIELSKEQTDGWQEFGYYPRLLNREIHEGYKIVLRHLEDYADAGDRIIADLLHNKVVDLKSASKELLENLRYYELHAESYANKFDAFDLSTFRHRFIEKMGRRPFARATRVLDAGCGAGRDLLAFMSAGIEVTGIDASPALLRYSQRKLRDARNNAGDKVAQNAALASSCIEMTFDEVRFAEEFDGVWAAASLLHVPSGQLEATLKQFLQALKPGGVLFMSFKYGRGQLRRGGRTFSCYDHFAMSSMLRRIGCLNKAEIWLSDARGVRLSPLRQLCAWAIAVFGWYDGSMWLNVLAQRPRT